LKLSAKLGNTLGHGKAKRKIPDSKFPIRAYVFYGESQAPEGRVFNLHDTLPPGLNGTYDLISDDQINFS